MLADANAQTAATGAGGSTGIWIAGLVVLAVLCGLAYRLYARVTPRGLPEPAASEDNRTWQRIRTGKGLQAAGILTVVLGLCGILGSLGWWFTALAARVDATGGAVATPTGDRDLAHLSCWLGADCAVPALTYDPTLLYVALLLLTGGVALFLGATRQARR